LNKYKTKLFQAEKLWETMGIEPAT